jgi:hypothetical protein
VSSRQTVPPEGLVCLQDRLCPLPYSWFDRHNSPRFVTNLNLWKFILEIEECCDIRTRALIVNIPAHTNKCTVLEYTLFKLKHYNSEMFRTFLMGHPQGGYIGNCIRLRS